MPSKAMVVDELLEHGPEIVFVQNTNVPSVYAKVCRCACGVEVLRKTEDGKMGRVEVTLPFNKNHEEWKAWCEHVADRLWSGNLT